MQENQPFAAVAPHYGGGQFWYSRLEPGAPSWIPQERLFKGDRGRGEETPRAALTIDGKRLWCLFDPCKRGIVYLRSDGAGWRKEPVRVEGAPAGRPLVPDRFDPKQGYLPLVVRQPNGDLQFLKVPLEADWASQALHPGKTFAIMHFSRRTVASLALGCRLHW